MNQVNTVGRKLKLPLVWTWLLLFSLLYPPLQSTSYRSDTNNYESSRYSGVGVGMGVGVGGRDFDGWGPFWHMWTVDFEYIDDALDVGYFIEGGYSIEWGVLLWEWLVVVLMWVLVSPIAKRLLDIKTNCNEKFESIEPESKE